MSNQKLSKIAKCLLLASFFTPLIYLGGFYYPFIITKVLFFRLIVQLAFSIYIILLISDYGKYKPKVNSAIILGFLLVVSSFVSAWLGLNFYKSFWSSFERMEGVIGVIYVFVWLFLLFQFFKVKEDWKKAFRSVIIAAFLSSIYAVTQKFGILQVFEAGIDRAAGTLGNAAFLAGYMLLSFGLGIYHYFQENNNKFKNFTLISVCLFLFTLLLTSTRGAILGVLVAFIWFLLVYAFFGEKAKIRQYSAIFLVIIVLTGSLFYLFRDNFKDSNIDLVRRMATISFQDATVKNRILVWEMALKEFKNYPIFGVGLENFNVLYNKHFNPKINEDWFDRTHNIYLDYLIQNGILGLLIYLSIFIYIFSLLWKKRKENFTLFLVFSSLLIAYGVHNFFVFDVLSTFFLFIFVLAFVSFREREEKMQDKEIGAFVQSLTLIILLICNIFIFYKLIYQPYHINKSLYTGYYYILADTDKSYDNFEEVLAHKYGSVEGALQLISMYNVLEEQGSSIDYSHKVKFRDLAKEKLRISINNFPLDIRLRMHFSQLLLNNNPNEEESKEIVDNLEKSIELSPERPEAYYLLLNFYLMNNQTEKAVEVVEGLINEIPWYGQAKLMIINSLYEIDPEKAEEYYKQGVDQAGVNQYTIKEVLEYLLSQERYEESIPYYLKLIEYYPDRYDYRVDLAKVYYLTNQREKAREQIEKINAHDPLLLQNEGELLNSLNLFN